MVAKALSLGARCGGIARPFLQAWSRGGRDGALRFGRRVIAEIRVACLLTGSARPADLAERPLVVGPRLARWLPAGSPVAARKLG